MTVAGRGDERVPPLEVVRPAEHRPAAPQPVTPPPPVTPHPAAPPHSAAPHSAAPQVTAPQVVAPHGTPPQPGPRSFAPGSPNAGLPNPGLSEAGLPNAGLPNTGLSDAGLPDAGPLHTGRFDSGLPGAATAEPRPAAPAKPVPLLLQGQDYLFRAQPQCLDFQEQVHRLGMVDEGDGGPVPCVLVLARAADMEMNELSVALAERGIRMARIDADRSVDLPLTVYTDQPLLELDRWLLRPLLVWRRHFELASIPVEPGTLAGAYAVDQWGAVANWLASRGDWAHVNPSRATAHLDRLTQLSDAAAFGLRVPRTTVTTRPGRTRPGGGRCIVKTSGRHLLEPRPGRQHGLFPRPLETSRAGDVPESAPVIVQEYVPAETELRVFVVGERCLAFQVDKLDPAQLWVDPGAVRVTPVEVPSGLTDRLLALARHWRLQVAAFDLLVAGGDHVFLEVNVNCDWRWFEHRAGDHRVSAAVHEWVAARFRELLDAGKGR